MVCALIYFLLCCLRQPISSCFRTRYAKNALPTLITIRFSHYCEKARWALDLLQHATTQKSTDDSSEKIQNGLHCYVERPRSIMTHMVSSLWHTSGFSTSTPVYITRDKRVIKDSSNIMHYVSDELQKMGKPTLYPTPEVEELENDLNQVLGVHARRRGYWLMFQNEEMQNELHKCWLRGTVGWEKWIQQHSFGPIKALITKGLQLEDRPSLLAKQRIDEVFEKVNQKLEEHGGMYLFNTTYPTAADLTFAALAYPMIFPPECDDMVIAYDSDVMSRQLYDEVTSYREQRAGKFVLQMYEQHRITHRI